MTQQEALEYFQEQLQQNLSKTRYVRFPDWMNDTTSRRIHFIEESYKRSAEEALVSTIREMQESLNT